jgi:hypothetical protein
MVSGGHSAARSRRYDVTSDTFSTAEDNVTMYGYLLIPKKYIKWEVEDPPSLHLWILSAQELLCAFCG